MTTQGQFARGSRVFPCSTKDLLEQANELRKLLCLKNIPKFPVIKFLEAMQSLYDDFDFEIVDKSELPKGYFAQYNPILGLVTISETIYKMANDFKNKGYGFARWTILHECLHHILHRNQLAALTRQDNAPHKTYEDSEWQVDTLASFLLMPPDMVNADMTVDYVFKTFGVSPKAARNRLKRLREEGR